MCFAQRKFSQDSEPGPKGWGALRFFIQIPFFYCARIRQVGNSSSYLPENRYFCGLFTKRDGSTLFDRRAFCQIKPHQTTE